jgi:hypothetical protein
MKDSSEVKCVKTADGTVIYYLNGKMHNWEGPAFLPQGNTKNAEYYLFGIKHTKEQWEIKKKDINGQPFYKTAVGKASGARV